MNCEQFREVMQDLARDEGLDFEKTKDALAHAESCGECDALLQESESITTALRMLSLQHSTDEAPLYVEAALLRSFAEKRVPVHRPANLSLWSLAGIGSIAAAALLSISMVRHIKPEVPVQGSQPPARVSMAASGGKAASLESHSANSDDEWLSAFGDNSTVDVATDETAAASFVPLSETFDPTSLDDDTVVRVVVSRATLESFGLSLGDGVDEQVAADLIVTNDGTPQAIRVVGK
jgi:hypothetical protein